MTVVGLDDTDSRTEGMCTTYVGTLIADRLRTVGEVDRLLLIRLNPAVPYKTRGNASVAIHTDVPVETAARIAQFIVKERAVAEDENTNPGIVVSPDRASDIPQSISRFTMETIREFIDIDDALDLCQQTECSVWSRGNGRGVIGALAAIGAWSALDDWTYEWLAYREPTRWGSERSVDTTSLFEAAADAYPKVWDTVDRVEREAVCVPRTPGPVLYGIRGEEPTAVRSVADGIDSEPIAWTTLFVTNQGTDVHLRESTIAEATDGQAVRVAGTVVDPPTDHRGGHVFFSISENGESLECVAFEPTKRFRDVVRSLRPGDRVSVCGEISKGTCKLEKLAIRHLCQHETVVPDCPECERTMESAGRGQGYRCRRCDTEAASKAEVAIDRSVDVGWYEVPPCARRHIAKPLVRGGFDLPVHPER